MAPLCNICTKKKCGCFFWYMSLPKKNIHWLTKRLKMSYNNNKDIFAAPAPLNKPRTSMSTSHYDVYKDGYPIENPPVVISNIHYERYLENPSLFDDSLKEFKVFGITVYRPPILPATKTVGLFSHGIIQFSHPEDAKKWVENTKNRVFLGSKLDFSFFAQDDPIFQKTYSYAGSEPRMGGKDVIKIPPKKYKNIPRIIDSKGKYNKRDDQTYSKSSELSTIQSKEKRQKRFSKNRSDGNYILCP